MVTTIAISNQKGGVAKTTTCLSLGACLAEMGQSVLLVDLDPHANLTLSFGLKPQELRRTVGDALLGNASLVAVSRESGVFNLDLIPANHELAVVDRILSGRSGCEFQLKNRLEAVGKGLYEIVLIDCPPSLGTLTLNALTAANLLVVPVQCEYYAAHSLRQVMGMVRTVRERMNPHLTHRLLVTMYDRRNKISRVILEKMQRELSDVLLSTIIEVDARLKESPAFAKPITLYAPNTRSAQQYRALAKELMNHERERP
jgi:chromosome partitioning protein